MSGYIDGFKIIEELNIREIDLLEAAQKGLQPHNQNGQPIPPPEISLKKKELTDLHLQLDKLIQEITAPLEKPLLKTLPSGFKINDFLEARVYHMLELGEHNRQKILDIKQSIENIENFVAPFKNNSWKLFQFITDRKISEALQVLNKSLFKKEEIEIFFKEHKKQTTEKLANITGSPDYSDFIKGTRISRESDDEIKINAPKHQSIKCDFKELGFRRNQDKGWKALLEILEVNFFSVGTLNKKGINKEYDRLQKRLRFINNKLIAFFNQQYKISIPTKLIFFESSTDGLPGKYVPTFQTVNSEIQEFSTKCSNLSDGELISIGQKLMSQLEKKQKGSLEANQIVTKLNIIAEQAKNSKNCSSIMAAISGNKSSDMKDVYESDRDRGTIGNTSEESED